MISYVNSMQKLDNVNEAIDALIYVEIQHVIFVDMSVNALKICTSLLMVITVQVNVWLFIACLLTLRLSCLFVFMFVLLLLITITQWQQLCLIVTGARVNHCSLFKLVLIVSAGAACVWSYLIVVGRKLHVWELLLRLMFYSIDLN